MIDDFLPATIFANGPPSLSACVWATIQSPLPGQLSLSGIQSFLPLVPFNKHSKLFNSKLSFCLLSLQCMPNQYQWNTPQVGKMQLDFSFSSGAFGQFWPVLDVCSPVADAILCSLVPPAVTICLPACWWSFCSATCVVHGGLHSGGADSSREDQNVAHLFNCIYSLEYVLFC